jgi:hypothetical protein
MWPELSEPAQCSQNAHTKTVLVPCAQLSRLEQPVGIISGREKERIG